MARQRLLVIVGEVHGVGQEAGALGEELKVARMEGARRIESPGGSEITAAEQKAQLIGGRTQAGGGLLNGAGKIKAALALGTIERVSACLAEFRTTSQFLACRCSCRAPSYVCRHGFLPWLSGDVDVAVVATLKK